MKKILIILLLSLPTVNFSAEILSVDELVNNRDIYDGKEIVVVGVFHLEFEANGLYGKQNSIWIDEEKLPILIRTDDAEKMKLQDKIVLLKANFSKEWDGHLQGTPGKFVIIHSIELYENDL